jgi:hypothetical protein
VARAPVRSPVMPVQVTGATFDSASGLWTVTAASGTSVRGRILICADGATSKCVSVTEKRLGLSVQQRGVFWAAGCHIRLCLLRADSTKHAQACPMGGRHPSIGCSACVQPQPCWSVCTWGMCMLTPSSPLPFCFQSVPPPPILASNAAQFKMLKACAAAHLLLPIDPKAPHTCHPATLLPAHQAGHQAGLLHGAAQGRVQPRVCRGRQPQLPRGRRVLLPALEPARLRCAVQVRGRVSGRGVFK